jgi:Zn-dependent peptidase ImmA (M78 family)/transcriptional regulator with XRE-family HTH domain
VTPTNSSPEREPNDVDFLGTRVRLARRFRGLTQRELGDVVTASPALISQVETGDRRPTDDLHAAFADALGFEPEFFLDPITDEFLEEECSFRRRESTPARLRERVLAHGTLVGVVIHYLNAKLKLLRYNVPRIPVKRLEDVETAARACREHWGLDVDAPLAKVGRVLEGLAGVPIAELDAQDEQVDAFSRRGAALSMIVLNTTKGSASRTLSDIAHEAGHLVMHWDQPLRTPEREKEAHRFAGAFLLPAQQFARELGTLSRLDWEHWFELKVRWRTSVAMMIYRAHDLGLIDAVQFRRFYKGLHKRGWHRDEPEEPQAERPELLQLALVEAAKRGDTPKTIARALHWKPSTFAEIVGLDHSEPIVDAGVVPLSDYRERRVM